MKVCRPALLVVLALAISGGIGCSSNSANSASSGSGVLYMASQGDSSVSAYQIVLSSGTLNAVGTAQATGTTPIAIAITPSIKSVFVANRDSNNVSSYTVNNDGSLTASSSATSVGTRPVALAIDPAGKFLFVANQGTFGNPASGTISAFTISGNSLAAVAGSPFPTATSGVTTSTGPTSLVVSASGNYLYVSNQYTNTVAAFAIASSGALTQLPASPFPLCTAPAVCSEPGGVAISSAGGFLYVANSGTNNISALAICDIQSATCPTPNGTLTEVSGSPFAAGIDPVAIAVDPGFNFLYVVNQQSAQVSEYSYSTGTGALTALTNPTIATGTTPVSIGVISGATGTNVGNTTTNPTDFVYVANIGSTTISAYSLTTSSGVLNVLGSPLTVNPQPSAIGVK